jgi:hypothetical protein
MNKKTKSFSFFMLVVSHTTPVMRRLLGALLGIMLAECCLAAFSCYRATPAVYIKPYSPNTRLLLDELISCLDTTAGTFLINSTTYFSDPSLTEKLREVPYGGDVHIFRQFAAQLPPVQLYGNLSFTQQGYMQFSYPNSSSLYCVQARSAPDLCPLLQTYTNGPFVFSADPSLSAPVMLTIQASQLGYVDPVTGVPYNFFYAPQPISLQCTTGSCASLANVVPPAPLPQNASFTVRRRFLTRHYNKQEDY